MRLFFPFLSFRVSVSFSNSTFLHSTTQHNSFSKQTEKTIYRSLDEIGSSLVGPQVGVLCGKKAGCCCAVVCLVLS